MDTFLHKWLAIWCVLSLIGADECPERCKCKRNMQGNGPDWVKLRCGDDEKIDDMDDLNLSNIAGEVVQLNLSNNRLTAFTLKIQLIALQKLDVSRNQISTLRNDQFVEVPNLRRLDISGNNLKQIEISAFSNLKHLERLKLNQNQIHTIIKGTFKSLDGLKQIDISNNPLACDCHLLWLLEWAEKKSVKLTSNPKCASPENFKGIPIRKLRIGDDLHCKSPAGGNVPVVELSPNHSQVVFEGDSLQLRCRATSGQDDRIEWLWLDANPDFHFNDLTIENKHQDTGLLTSSLFIPKLNRNHTGIWNCRLISSDTNHLKGITVVVISDETKYCPITSTTNNKGTYVWPRAVVNYTVTMPCESMQLSSEISEQKVSYFCSLLGNWEDLNSSNCSYISETTKILEQFSKVNLSLAKSNVLESARHFKNYTADLKILKDVMDLVYVVRTVQNYLDYTSMERELGAILMEVSNKLLDLPDAYLRAADVEDNSCSKLIGAIEKIAKFTPSPLLHKTNVALEIFPVKQETFTGMTCTWYINPADKTHRTFNCVTSNYSSLNMQDKLVEASVQIPATLFYQLREQDVLFGKSSHELLVSMYDSGKLFPMGKHNEIISAIIGLKLDNFVVKNLSDPIYVMLRKSIIYETHPVPVWWDSLSNNGNGGWSTEGCRYNNELQDNLVFYCKQLGYYGLRQDVTQVNYAIAGAKFKFSHPAIYIGSVFLFVCLLSSILTYLFCYVAIQMPKKAKHSLINTWIAISLLCFMYVFGIYQTEDVQICQAVGLILHYCTVSSLLWMCVGMNSMYKRLRKNDVIELQDDELPLEEPVQKPILGLYFVGWGVALIVCGISGAVNMKEYSSHDHCFLNSEPALSALYVPCVILIFILFIFFLLIRCTMYNVDTGGQLSEGTQATENVDLDLLEPSFPTVEMRSIRSVSTKTGSSDIEDPEHTPSVQLKAHVIFLVMYVATWLSCALATVRPRYLLIYEDFFCVLYAVSCVILGSFTIFFYCIARNDVRQQWVWLGRCVKKKSIFRSRNVSDTAQNMPQIQIQPLPPIPNETEVHVTSRSSSRSSHTKSNSHNSNILKAAVDLNAPNFHEPRGVKINNVNLVILHRQQYRNMNVVPNLIENPTSTAEMFYNPHQSTVARKFFKKQKRNMMKRNNLTTRRPDFSDNTSVASFPKRAKDNSSVDQSIYGTNSKVNNTNIHVEKVHKTKYRNPNVFDSCEDMDKYNQTKVNKPKKKRQNTSAKSSLRDNNMRSVSQQCTLEYSSEPISDSILDQKSPEKVAECFDAGVASTRRENSPIESVEFIERTLDTLYEPSEVSLSIVESTSEFNKAIPRIYVNPSHDFFMKRVQSRASSVSASELDELYQEIRGARTRKNRRYLKDSVLRHASPCFSDSEINSCVGDVDYRTNFMYDQSDKIESTV